MNNTTKNNTTEPKPEPTPPLCKLYFYESFTDANCSQPITQSYNQTILTIYDINANIANQKCAPLSPGGNQRSYRYEATCSGQDLIEYKFFFLDDTECKKEVYPYVKIDGKYLFRSNSVKTRMCVPSTIGPVYFR